MITANTIIWLAIIGFLLWVILVITFLAFLIIPTAKQMHHSRQVQQRMHDQNKQLHQEVSERIKNNKGK